MAKPKSTSSLDFRNFHIAAQYAEGDESTNITFALGEYLRKFPVFQSILKQIFSTVRATDKNGRLHLGHGESMSGNFVVMHQVSIAFVAGVAYGQRFGDNLSEPLPPVNREYLRVRTLTAFDNEYKIATDADFEEVVRWRLDARGKQALLEEDGLEARALARIRERERHETTDPSGARPITSSPISHTLSSWVVETATRAFHEKPGWLQ